MKIVIYGNSAKSAEDAAFLARRCEVSIEEETAKYLARSGVPLPEKARVAPLEKAAPGADYIFLEGDPGKDLSRTGAIERAAVLARPYAGFSVVRCEAPAGFIRRLREEKGAHVLYMPAVGARNADNAPTHCIVGADLRDPAAAGAAERLARFIGEAAGAPFRVLSEEEAETVSLFSGDYLDMQRALRKTMDEFAAANGLDAEALAEGMEALFPELNGGKKS